MEHVLDQLRGQNKKIAARLLGQIERAPNKGTYPQMNDKDWKALSPQKQFEILLYLERAYDRVCR